MLQRANQVLKSKDNSEFIINTRKDSGGGKSILIL